MDPSGWYVPTTAPRAPDNVCSGGADAADLERERRKESRKGKKESEVEREGGTEEGREERSREGRTVGEKPWGGGVMLCVTIRGKNRIPLPSRVAVTQASVSSSWKWS